MQGETTWTQLGRTRERARAVTNTASNSRAAATTARRAPKRASPHSAGDVSPPASRKPAAPATLNVTYGWRTSCRRSRAPAPRGSDDDEEDEDDVVEEDVDAGPDDADDDGGGVSAGCSPS